MTPITIAKFALALAGILVWGMGLRLDISSLRMIGIGLMATALILRFAKGRHDNKTEDGS